MLCHLMCDADRLSLEGLLLICHTAFSTHLASDSRLFATCLAIARAQDEVLTGRMETSGVF